MMNPLTLPDKNILLAQIQELENRAIAAANKDQPFGLIVSEMNLLTKLLLYK